MRLLLLAAAMFASAVHAQSYPSRAVKLVARAAPDGYTLIAWFALVAPAGTPAPVVSRLHDTAVKSLAKPEVKARFDALGTDVGPISPEQLGGFIRAEIDKWAKMAKAAGIQPE